MTDHSCHEGCPCHRGRLPASDWVAFCERHGQDPDDPDAFCVTPPNRLRRMLEEFETRRV